MSWVWQASVQSCSEAAHQISEKYKKQTHNLWGVEEAYHIISWLQDFVFEIGPRLRGYSIKTAMMEGDNGFSQLITGDEFVSNLKDISNSLQIGNLLAIYWTLAMFNRHIITLWGHCVPKGCSYRPWINNNIRVYFVEWDYIAMPLAYRSSNGDGDWQPLQGILSWYPLIIGKSLCPIWRWGTHDDLQLNYRD